LKTENGSRKPTVNLSVLFFGMNRSVPYS